MKREELIALLKARGIPFKADATDQELKRLLEDSQKTREGSDLQMRAMFDPTTLKEDERTVDVTFATETPVRMYTWDGPIMEILSMQDGHVRWERINGGAPVLDNHDKYSGVRGVLGIVEKAWKEGNVGRATIRFSKRDDVEPVWQDVKDGILKGISVGYRVYTYEKTEREGQLPEYRAIDWEPHEISLAPVQADYNSAIRSLSSLDQLTTTNNSNSHIMKREQIIALLTKRGIQFDANASDEDLLAALERAMETPQNKPEPPAPAPKPAQGSATETPEQIRAAERKRSQDITEAVRKAGLPESYALELIGQDINVDQARAAIIEKWAEKDPNKGQRNLTVGADETDKRRDAMIDGLLLRGAPDMNRDNKLVSVERASAAREFRGMTLLDMAKDSLRRAGVNTNGMDNMEIVGRAITSSSSDFPILLEGTNRRVLLAAYDSQPDMWSQFCAIGSVNDFREYKRLRTGSLTRLSKVNENGEYKNVKIPDAEFERIMADTYGMTINVTRKMIINDDLAGLTRLAQMLGRAAARSIEIDVFSMFAENSGNGPLMADGQPLFHSSHANIAATAGVPSVDSFDAARQQMAIQKDPSNNDFLNLRPNIWLGPLKYGSTARILNGSQYDPDAANKLQRPNVVAGLVSSVLDSPRLGGNAWYMLANPGEEPVFEVVFLNGQRSPFLESQEGFTVDGMTWKIRHDYGFGAIGWRGIIKNAGPNS